MRQTKTQQRGAPKGSMPVSVRLTHAMIVELKKAAEYEGMPLSIFIRHAAIMRARNLTHTAGAAA
jgi:predicted DNA binding CopG/RHH family protein